MAALTTLEFMEGFDHLGSADYGVKWNTIVINPTIQAPRPNSTGTNPKSALVTGAIAKTLTPAANNSIVVGVAYRDADTSTSCMVLDVRGSAQPLLQVQRDAITGLWTVTIGGVSYQSTDPLQAYQQGNWIYIEVAAHFVAAAGGKFTMRIGGQVVTGLQRTGITTTTGGVSQLDTVRLQPGSHAASYDDFFVKTGSAGFNDIVYPTANYDFFGDARIETKFPEADSGVAGHDQWAIGGTTPAATRWQSCNDQPMTLATGDVTTVETSTNNNIQAFNMQDLVAVPVVIHGVQLNVIVRKQDPGVTHTLSNLIHKIGTGDTVLTAQNIQDTYQANRTMHPLNPDAVAWTAAHLSGTGSGNFQFGGKLIS